MEYFGTEGPDVIDQDALKITEPRVFFGLGGDDILRIRAGDAVGGPGNDTIINLGTDRVAAIYADSPGPVVIHLAAGYADDGWGTRDTLAGIYYVHGSRFDDRFIGSAANEIYVPNGGRDIADGGGGIDTVMLTDALDRFVIRVSVDGATAVITHKADPGLRYELTNIERIVVALPGRELPYIELASLIDPADMGIQGLTGADWQRWNAPAALGTPVEVTYSFVESAPSSGPGATGFRAFTAAERGLVREILAATAGITGLTFREVDEAGGAVGAMRFGVSQQVATRGVAFAPNQPGAGDAAGDVWMDVDSMANLAPGSEGYAALLHEIGHALGLRHPRNVDPGDSHAVQLRAQDAIAELTVMAPTVANGGLNRGDWGLLDIVALRHLYGTRLANTGDTVHRLTDAAAISLRTLVDDGGSDTLDASSSTVSVHIDLRPGQLSSVGRGAEGGAAVNNIAIAIGSWIEHAIGSAYDDVLLGNALDNRLSGGLGNDWIDGGDGIDTAVFAARRADYELSNGFGKLFVKARDGQSGFDTLLSIERLQFADQTVELSATALGADVNASVDEDGALTLQLPDPDDLPRGSVTYRLVDGPANGTATISAQGALRYVPRADFHGADLIAFDMQGAGGGNRYLVFVEVRPVNDGPPLAAPAEFLASNSFALQAMLPRAKDPDGDAVTYLLASQPSHGEASVSAGGSLIYMARAGFQGTDRFEYTVSDGEGGSSTYPVAIVVRAASEQLRGTAAGDILSGGAAAELILGLEGNDRITGGGGNDLIDGGAGTDTALYSGSRSNYKLTRLDSGWSVEAVLGGEGTDLLLSVERLRFRDTSVALDLDGAAGTVAQILRALFGPSYLGNKEFVGIGLHYLDSGVSYEQLVALAIGTDVFASLAGGRSNAAFVNHVYRNVVGVAPDAPTLAQFVSLLDSAAYTQQSLALLACQIGINAGSVDLVGLAATGIEFTPYG